MSVLLIPKPSSGPTPQEEEADRRSKKEACKQGRERTQPVLGLERKLRSKITKFEFPRVNVFSLGFPAGTQSKPNHFSKYNKSMAFQTK